MTDAGDEDMHELLILKKAAAEIGVDPSYLRRRIAEGKLKADKYGGRDWWIRRDALKAFDHQRRPVGRPLDSLKPASADMAQERERTYQREYRRQYRARQIQAAQEAAPPSKSKDKTGKRG